MILTALLLTFPPAPLQDATERVWEGRVHIEGHYERPGEVRDVRTRLIFTDVGDARECVWSVWGSNDGAPSTSRRLSTPAGFWFSRGGAWQASSASHDIAFTQALLRLGDPTQSGPTPLAHPRLGDVHDLLERADDGSLRARIHDLGAVYTFVLEAPEQRAATFSLPSELPEPAPSPSIEPLVAELAPNVWAVVLADVDARCLAVRVGGALAILEAPTSSAHGERIVDALARAVPDTPIRWVLFSHYHPHYTGALRAFLAAGATVVTTPNNESFVRAVAARPFTRVPDRWQSCDKPVCVQLVHGRWTLDDGATRIEALDIGARSRHTDEYVVFSLPRQGLLFHGDLGWYADGQGGVRAGSRAAALVEVLDEEQLAPERIVQSWPALGVPATLTPAELRKLVPVR